MFTDFHLNSFNAVFRELGVSAYLCGGTVRDLAMGRPFRDVDLVLSDRVLDAARLFRTKINAPYFVLDEARKIVRVVCDQGNWDFSGFRNGDIEGDLRRRDFTINALAVDWRDFYPDRTLRKIIDPFSGLEDLNQKKIRTVTEQSLEEDPLRMLRAFRIHAELGFEIDPEVFRQIVQIHQAIQSVAAERVTEELDRILLQPDAARTFRMLGDCSLLWSILPEARLMTNCKQGGYHHLDVWNHSLLALEKFESLLRNLSGLFPSHESFLQQYLNSVPGTLERRRLLKWAALFHDIGKPATQEPKEPGRWSFHGHDHVGADLMLAILKRLKFARKDTQLIALLIEHHLRPLNLLNLEETTDESFYRFFRAAGPEAIGTLLIAYGDLSAASGPLADAGRISVYVDLANRMIRYYREQYYPAVNTPELLKGRDLMAVFQMNPGPQMGQLLKEIREAQLSGSLRSRNDALDFAEKWLRKRP